MKTQIQRESLLAKEAKYEHGLKKSDYDYEELMQVFRDNNNASRSENRAGKSFKTLKLTFIIYAKKKEKCNFFRIERFLGKKIESTV